MIQFYNKNKNKSIIIWTCFENNSQKSDLIFISDNSEAKWEEIISAIYLKVLEKQILILWEFSLIYIQNETLIHITYIIKRWFTNNEIKVID